MPIPADKGLGKTARRYRAWIGSRRLAVLCLISGFCLAASSPRAYSFAIGVAGTIDLKGNNFVSDSFDSSDSLYSTNGVYTASKRKAGGDLISCGSISNSVLNVGNANIAGHILVGPGANSNVGIAGSVGDLPWVGSNMLGVQPGWLVTNLSFYFPPVVLPATTWLTPPGPGVMDGNPYAHVFNVSGDYQISDSGDIYVGTNVSVRLNITTSVFSPNNIFVAGVATNEAGRMVAYLNGAPGQVLTFGTTDKTQSGRASNLVFMGLPNCTDIVYKGNGNFTGVIYAPSADFHLAGGGSSNIDFVGSSFTKTFQQNGHYHFHFDEALYQMTIPFPYLFAADISDQGRYLLPGQSATFQVTDVLGAGPFSYQWHFQQFFIPITNTFPVVDIPGATNATLTVTNVQGEDSGIYSVTISNQAGSAYTSALLAVYPLDVTYQAISTNGTFQFWVSGAYGQNYVIESSTNLVNWSAIGTNAAWSWFTDTNPAAYSQRFYRAVYVP
jgi:Immunoglobulin I-set domain